MQEHWCQKNWIIWCSLTLLSNLQTFLAASELADGLWSLSFMHGEEQGQARVPGSPGTCPPTYTT